ncbi:MAG: protease inhibitor I42 family protein [Dehalococcoidales bacterium]|nr:protease inhibitor I42 family protein [Dehalococcoidales bacterium]
MKLSLLSITVLIAAICLGTGCHTHGVAQIGEDNSINVSVNEEFILTLDTDATNGYSWYESHDPMMLELVGRTYRKGEHTKPELSGSTGGVEYFSYKALKTGETEIIMTYERPWYKETIKQEAFTVNIH